MQTTQAVTQPPDDPSKFLPWALTILMAVAVFIWRLRESERTAELVRLRAENDAQKKEITEWQAKWSTEVKERAKDSELFMRALAKKQGDSSRPPQS